MRAPFLFLSRYLVYGLIWLCFAPCLAAQEGEEILSFHSKLRVDEQAQLWVTETLRVRAAGTRIKRGIYREFPTRYRDRLGNRYQVDFTLLSVQRNGQPEPYQVKQVSNGLRIYIGDENYFLAPDEYDYRLEYRTNRQLGFFADFDELYWNVTGNGWIFPIAEASGELSLPSGQTLAESDLRLALYTGRQGSQASFGEIQYLGQNRVSFRTTRPLAANEGLSIAVGFPTGLVERPSAGQKLLYLLRDNRALLWALIAVTVVFAYYLHSWWRVGRDPRKGTIIPEYEPPQQLSPAACAYVLRMGLNDAALSAALISCAVKGYLEIVQEGKAYQLKRPQQRNLSQSGELSPGEHRILSSLLAAGETLQLEQGEHQRWGKARKALKEYLEGAHHEKLFHKNSTYFWRGFFLGLGAIVIELLLQPTAFALILLVVGLLVQFALFYHLLYAPTQAGRRVMDRIEGFRMYLNTAEADRLEAMRGPELTPEVFERFLPYAFALGVANSWCQRFDEHLRRTQTDTTSYQPSWYYGGALGAPQLSHLGQDLGSSFSAAISSAATPPGSSSGSGGGGSSGGGGGGGGGGGW